MEWRTIGKNNREDRRSRGKVRGQAEHETDGID